jgi:hypothetical protein
VIATANGAGVSWVTLPIALMGSAYVEAFAASPSLAAAAITRVMTAITATGSAVFPTQLARYLDDMADIVETQGLFLTRADGNRFLRTRTQQLGGGRPLSAGGSLRNIYRYYADGITVSLFGINGLPVFYDIGNERRASLANGTLVRTINREPGVQPGVAANQVNSNTGAGINATLRDPHAQIDGAEAANVGLNIYELNAEFGMWGL